MSVLTPAIALLLSLTFVASLQLASGFASNELYRFGSGIDASLDNSDDFFAPVGVLASSFNLYGISYESVFVSTNGPVSFNSGTTTCCNRDFPTFPPMVAAFWHDINPITGGIIYHRVINSGSELITLGDLLEDAAGSCPQPLSFTPSSAAVITFDQVSQFGGSSNVNNTFQVILLTDGTRSFAVFIYNDISWGDGATIGFNDGTSFYTLEGGEAVFATTPDVGNLTTTSNIDVPGVFVFRTDLFFIQEGEAALCGSFFSGSGSGSTPELATPTNLTSPSQSPTSITLAWDQPAGDDVGLFFIAYTYQGECTDFVQRVNRISVNGTTRAVTLQGLEEFSSYAITVTAVGSGGSSTSDTLVVNTTAAAPSAPPLFVTSSAVSLTNITIQWGRVSCINRNSEIIGYTVRYSQVGLPATSVNESVLGTTDSDRVFTLTGLTPRTSYVFEVAAISSDATGPFRRVTVETGFVSILYPFGAELDLSLQSGDDTSTDVGELSTPYILYGNSYTMVDVSSNGPVTFSPGTASCCVRTLPTAQPLVTAFWHDINLSVGGVLYHRVINNGSELGALGEELRNYSGSCPQTLDFTPSSAVVVTFHQVSQFAGNSAIHNTFQTILLTDGNQSYSIFLYDSMSWGSGATIGFNNGTSFYTLEGGEGVFATTPNIRSLIMTSNIDVPGVFVFRTDLPTIAAGRGALCPSLLPMPPTNLTSPSQSPTSITLSWEQPAGDDVDSYVIVYIYQGECSNFTQPVNSITVNGTAREVTLQGLEEFSSYAIAVTAVNSGGSSTSDVLTVNTTTAAPSGSPQFLNATSVTSTSITVQWGPVNCIDRNSEIIGYTVRYRAFVFGGTLVNVSISGTSDSDRVFTASGLIPNTLHVFQIAAVSSEGTGPFSTSIIAQTERPLLQFEQDEIYVSEGNIEEICVQVTPSDINFTVSLQQTAGSTGELSISPQELRFFPGEAEKCFIVEALEDSTLEETLESYTLELTASTAAIVLNEPLITVNILDRDYLVIETAISSLEVPEGDTATACALIGEGSSATTLDRAVVLRVVGSATGATPGVDFSARIVNPDIFLFPPGSPVGSEACLSFTIFQDNITEPEPESVTLLLEAFDIGVTIPEDTATFNIIDVEVPTDAPTTQPPPERGVTFVGGTPFVDSNNRLIFTLVTEADSLDCRISGRVECRVGENLVEGLDPGLHLLRVIAIFGAERVEEQRRIYIPEGEECSVVLINNGLTFDGESLEVEFGGIRGAQEFECRIDRGDFEPCESPYRLELPGISPGRHRLRIIPTDCEDRQPQNFDFTV